MRIDALGRLLVGTTTEGNANADDLTVASSGNTGITIVLVRQAQVRFI